MSKVTKVLADRNWSVDVFVCSECNERFGYTGGFPNHCPECGAEFDQTAEEIEKGK